MTRLRPFALKAPRHGCLSPGASKTRESCMGVDTVHTTRGLRQAVSAAGALAFTCAATESADEHAPPALRIMIPQGCSTTISWAAARNTDVCALHD